MNLYEDMTALVKELEKNRQTWQASVVKEAYRSLEEMEKMVDRYKKMIDYGND